MIHRILCIAFCMASTSSAQSVWVVDGEGGAGVDFQVVQEAIDAAVDGDLVLLAPGVYDPFTIDGKSLVVQGDGAGVSMIGPLTVRNVSAQGQVMLRGIDIENLAQQPFPNFLTAVLLIENCAGPVWVEEVRTNTVPPTFPFGFGAANFGTDVVSCASVVFARCELVAVGFDGLFIFDSTGLNTFESNVSLYDCLVRGGQEPSGYPQNFRGSSGIAVSGGTLFLSGSDVAGGDGFDGQFAGTMCEFCAGGDAGAGILALGTSPSVRILDTSVVAGSSGAAGMCFVSPCAAGSPNLDVEVQAGTVVQLAGAARRMVVNSPVRDGEVVSETWIGEPGDLILLVFSLKQIPSFSVPEIVGTNVIGLPFFARLKGFIGPSGSKTQNITIQDAVPALGAVTLYKQSLFIDASLNLTSGGPTALVLLDDLL